MGDDIKKNKEKKNKEKDSSVKWLKKILKMISTLLVLFVPFTGYIGDYMLYKKALDYSEYFGIPSHYFFDNEKFIINNRLIVLIFSFFFMAPCITFVVKNDKDIIDDSRINLISIFAAVGFSLLLLIINLRRVFGWLGDDLSMVFSIILYIALPIIIFIFIRKFLTRTSNLAKESKKAEEVITDKKGFFLNIENEIEHNSDGSMIGESTYNDKLVNNYLSVCKLILVVVFIFFCVSFDNYYRADEVNMFEVIENPDLDDGYYDVIINKLDDNRAVVMTAANTYHFKAKSYDGETVEAELQKTILTFKKGEYRIESLEGKN